MLRFVQFPHPGPEALPNATGCVDWNRAEDCEADQCDGTKHRRKFMEVLGSCLDHDEKVRYEGSIWFWGEWEPESELIRRFHFDITSELPQCLWNRYWKPKKAYRGLQNTDPFVFDGFRYAICRQPRNQGLTSLPIGSVIVFGSRLNRKWVVDTVFVVAQSYPYTPGRYRELLNQHGNVPEGYPEVVFEPLCGSRFTNVPLQFYVGATYDNPVFGMYSFFPCKPASKDSHGFRRPALVLRDTLLEHYINPRLVNAAGGANEDLRRESVQAVWRVIKRQVLQEGLYPGISAKFPDKRD